MSITQSNRSRLAVAMIVLAATVGSLSAAPVSAAPIDRDRFPTEEIFVDQAYRDILSRPPDPEGLAFWSAELRSGTDPDDLIELLMTSEEFAGQTAPIVRLYRSVFDRLPDLGGLRFWVGKANAGVSLPGLADAFLASAEFEELADAQSSEEIVAAIYGRSLGRTPDAEGLGFWQGELDAGRLTLPEFVATISESPEHQALRNGEVTTTLIYLGLLQRVPEPGGLEYWSSEVDGGFSIRAFAATVMALPEYRSRFSTAPTVETTVVADGLTIPWDVESLPDGTLLVTERGGGITAIDADGARAVSADFSDLFASGETGVMGLAVDPDFGTNRRIYTCQGQANPREIKVVAWTLDTDATSAVRVADPLVGGLPINSGRHGGCQLEFDSAGHLFIGTGDAASGSLPQNLASLGGKVLRVDPANGAPVADNPFIGSDNAATRLIYTLGHRNVQGLSERPGTGQMWSVEHGPSRDDEITPLRAGGNGGWNPVPGYNESVPMTGTSFANVMAPAYATGQPTLALAGGEWIDDPDWGSWDGALAATSLKNSTLRLFFFDDDGRSLGQRVVIDRDFGRLRATHQAADGSLYVTTSNGGGNDRVIRVRPS